MPKKKPRILRRFTLSPIWHTVYSDLVTNLMLFFLLLFASTRLASTQKAQLLSALAGTGMKEGDVAVRAQQVLHRLQEQETLVRVGSFGEEEAFSEYAKLEVNEQMIKITLESPVLFATGESKLTKKALPIIDEIAEFIRTIPGNVVVEGHTDNIPVVRGRYGSNWELSIARAFSVIKYLTEEKGLTSERFVAAGYGEFRPLYPNDTVEHRAFNRRIEINVLRSEM